MPARSPYWEQAQQQGCHQAFFRCPFQFSRLLPHIRLSKKRCIFPVYHMILPYFSACINVFITK